MGLAGEPAPAAALRRLAVGLFPLLEEPFVLAFVVGDPCGSGLNDSGQSE